MQRPIDAFAEKDVVDVTVALEQLDLRNLQERPVHLLRSSRRRAIDTKDPDIQLVLRLPLLKNLQHIGIAARNADRGEARSIHVLDQGPAAGFQLFRRNFGKLRGHRASGRDVALDHPRRLSAGVAHESSL